MNFLYLHGFNSDGDGWKAQALRQRFPASSVFAPDLPAQPSAVLRLLEELLLTIPTTSDTPLVLLGTSLGGFYAYYLSAVKGLPALLFNPSLQPHETLDDRGIGEFQTWTKGRDYHFKVEYLLELAQLKQEAEKKVDVSRLRFFLAEDDEVLDLNRIPANYPEASIRWYSKAGHGFSVFEKVLKEGQQEGWLS